MATAEKAGIVIAAAAASPEIEPAAAASPATATALAVLVETDLPYATEHLPDGTTKIWTLDRYRPAQADAALTLVYFYGAGGVKTGEASLATALAEQGAEVLVIAYPDAQPDVALANNRDGFRRMLQTGACAVYFAHGAVGPAGKLQPVLLAGFSLGGGLAAQLALGGDDLARYWDFFAAHQGAGVSTITCAVDAPAIHVAAIVGFAGAYDAFVGYDGKWGRAWLAAQDPEFLAFLFSAVGMNPELAIRLFHGDSDNVIPYANSQAFSDLLYAAGYQVELVAFPGDHYVPAELLIAVLAGLGAPRHRNSKSAARRVPHPHDANR
jgi:acetyl esterase/lipase